MKTSQFGEFRVKLRKDKETGQVVAEVPALDIADYGLDSQRALKRLEEMTAFHLECLLAEGKPIPQEKRTSDGLYLKLRILAHAA